MLMVQEWWKWLENEQQQLSGSWRVCSWVRVKQVAQEEMYNSAKMGNIYPKSPKFLLLTHEKRILYI